MFRFRLKFSKQREREAEEQYSVMSLGKFVSEKKKTFFETFAEGVGE